MGKANWEEQNAASLTWWNREGMLLGMRGDVSPDLAVIYGVLNIKAGKWRGLTFGPTTVIEPHQVSENLKTEPISDDLKQEAA